MFNQENIIMYGYYREKFHVYHFWEFKGSKNNRASFFEVTSDNPLFSVNIQTEYQKC